MHDATPAPMTLPPAAARLARDVAELGLRLASLIGSITRHGEPSELAAGFLRGHHEHITTTLEREPDVAPRGEEHPIDRLARRFSLSECEVDLVLLAGMPEEHEGLASVLRSLHPRSEPRVTLGLAAQLLCPSPAERLSLRRLIERGPAARAGLLRVDGHGAFFERDLSLPDGLWSALLGLDVWPAGLAPQRTPPEVAGLDAWVDAPLAQRAGVALRSGHRVTVAVSSSSESAAFERAAQLCARVGVAAVGLRPSGDDPRASERLASIFSVAHGVVPLWIAAPSEHGGAEPPGFAEHPGPAVVCAREDGVAPRGERASMQLVVEAVTPRERRAAWSSLVPELAPHAELLASRYPIELATLRAVAADVRAARGVADEPPSLSDVATSVRARSNVALQAGVRRVRPTARWRDLVLPTRVLRPMQEAIDRLTHQARVLDEWGFLRGRPGARGVRMLMVGPPGTGKTLSAEVMASALGVDLLVVDISRVVSKWIGETEKNLASVFDAAERAQAVLLFDEADALFGKRTEISDARDRYANLETAYLLSRLERFEGLTVLSTNYRQNIDGAFTRRLEFVLQFEEPAEAERAALWRSHLPPGAPVADEVDLDEVASLYPMVGGWIRNAAVAAGFLAAAEGRPLGRRHLARAIQREFEKAGRAFPGMPWGDDVD